MSQINEKELYDRLKNALNALEKERQRVKELKAVLQEPIAIIGMACDLPGNIQSLDAFWQSLVNLEDTISPLTDSRWSTEQYVDPKPQTPGKMISDKGSFLLHQEQFDASFFGISPREAVSMDPQQRLVLKNTWRALEHAGIAPHTLKGSDTGLFIGATNTDYGHALLKQNQPERIDGYSATGTALNVIAGRTSYFFDIHGPSVVMDTACSSSLVALHYACQSLRQKDCSLALCSGVNVILLPEGNIALSQANMLSPQGRCYTFDARANGYVRGEGCITLVLKPYSQALKDKDVIYALIKGSAINHGGKSTGLTVPNAKAQAQLIHKALGNASLEPEEIDYIETHGTGTALGDPIEINALNEVFAGSHQAQKPLLIGSVKTNFGHLESASGLLGLLKVVLSMHHGLLPGTPHFQTLNPMIHLDKIPAEVVVTQRAWNPINHAGISSFGFSGINAHIIVAPADEKLETAAVNVDRSFHFLGVSAKDETALEMQKKQLLHFIKEHPHLAIADLAYSYMVTRDQFPLRQAFVIKTVSDLEEQLKCPIPAQTTGKERKKIAFLISGQGSQYGGMGKNLYQTSTYFKLWIDKGCALIKEHFDYDLLEILFDEQDIKLNQTLHTQPLLFIFNYALAKLWMSWGIEPDCLIGHSIGEYVAATLAGIMTFPDALNLVYQRARLMQGLPQEGGMLLVMAPKEKVEPFLAAYAVDIGIITEDYTVLSGLKKDLDLLEPLLPFAVKPLVLSHAFHSALMDPILDEFEQIASTISYHAPQKQIISNVSGNFYGAEIIKPQYWRNHLRQAVDLRQSMATLQAHQFQVLLEIGPRPTFSKSSKQFQNLVWVYSLRKEWDNWHSLLMNLAKLYELGMDIKWQRFDEGYLRQKMLIPGYPFQEKPYWGLDERQDLIPKEALYQVLYEPQALKPYKNPFPDSVSLLTQNKPLIAAFQQAFPQVCVSKELSENDNSEHIVYAFIDEKQDLAKSVKSHYQRFLTLIQQLCAKPQNKVTLWILQRDSQLALSPLLGLRKCLLLETTHIDCRLLSLDDAEWDDKSYQKIFAEMHYPSEEKQVYFQKGQRVVPRLESLPVLPKTKVLSKKACYLLSGGQGALGRLVAQWYVEQGISHLVILSRSAPSEEMNQLIKNSAKRGCKIDCLTLDVGDKKALEGLFAEFGHERPPLKGIIHAAGVLEDALILNQNWQGFTGLYKAKVLGAWYLHELSQQLKLNHFILFSSIASLLGTPGQGNYAAANAFLDQLAAFRQEQHLPALSINWGPWDEIGMAKDIKPQLKGLTKWTPSEGMLLFHLLMNSQTPSQVMAAKIDWSQVTKAGMSLSFFNRLRAKASAVQESALAQSLDVNALRQLNPAALKILLIQELQKQLQNILRLDAPLEAKKNFFELGMDSLMAIELRNNLQILLKHQVVLSQTLLFELSTLDELADYLVQTILDAEVQPDASHLLSKEEQILQNLGELSEEEIDALLQEALNHEE